MKISIHITVKLFKSIGTKNCDTADARVNDITR